MSTINIDETKILKNIGKYDFEKLNKCFDNPHSTAIGFWSYWWLTQCKNGFVKDSGMKVIKDNGRGTHADLNLFGENGELYGVLEVENSTESYEINVYNLSNYPKNFKNSVS